MREIKFRVWTGEAMVTPAFITRKGMAHWSENSVTERSSDIMQYTGLKDKKKDLTYVYEGDIIDESGIIKGNIYETPELLKDETNIVIANMGTDAWRGSEQEAIRRGCEYAK